MNNKGEKFLYIENKSGYNFVLLFIVLNIVAFLTSLDRIVIDSGIMVYSMFNILLSLLTFLAATQQKIYSKKWAYISLVIAVVQVIRVFLSVPVYRDTSIELFINSLLIVSAVSLVVGSAITLWKNNLRQEAEGLQKKPVAH